MVGHDSFLHTFNFFLCTLCVSRRFQPMSTLDMTLPQSRCAISEKNKCNSNRKARGVYVSTRRIGGWGGWVLCDTANREVVFRVCVCVACVRATRREISVYLGMSLFFLLLFFASSPAAASRYCKTAVKSLLGEKSALKWRFGGDLP